MEDARRRSVARPGGRYFPCVEVAAVDADFHGLAGAIDLDPDAGLGAIRGSQESYRQRGQESSDE